MADSRNSTRTPETEAYEHPSDVMFAAIDKLQAILNLICNDYQDEENGFLSPDKTIYSSVAACAELVDEIAAALNRQESERDRPKGALKAV